MFLLARARGGDRLLQRRDMIFLGIQAIEARARQQGDQLVGRVAGVRRQPERIVGATPIEIRDALPRTAVGKLSKKELRRGGRKTRCSKK